MITKIAGKLVAKKEQSVILNVQNLFYEILVPVSVLNRIDETMDGDGHAHLVTYYYFQMGPSAGIPVLIGFINEIERAFFLEFIKVSGIGPRAAVRAFNKPISEISRAIDEGDVNFLKTLPGIGQQRAKEIVAKLQGKIGKFCLIQDRSPAQTAAEQAPDSDWQEEALEVLIQLQYKKPEAVQMIQKALERDKNIETAEALLNEIYKQRIKK